MMTIEELTTPQKGLWFWDDYDKVFYQWDKGSDETPVEKIDVPFLLSQYFFMDDFVERLEEAIRDNTSRSIPAFEDATKAQIDDLDAMISKTLDDWQMKHGIRLIECLKEVKP